MENGYSGLIRDTARERGIACSEEQALLLAQYAELLLKWNRKINLISENDTFNVIDRHMLDSIEQFDSINRSYRHIADIGSGNGFPGIVIAVFHPEIHIDLIEKRAKRASFLKQCVFKLSLKNAHVFDRDAAQFDYSGTDAVISRAVGTIERMEKLLRGRYSGKAFIYESGGMGSYDI